MLKPSMQDLMKRVNNRYLLVNLAAQRARDLSAEEEKSEIRLEEKPIKVALDEISTDKIEYRPGPKPETEDLLAAAAEDTAAEAGENAEAAEEEELVSIGEDGTASDDGEPEAL